MADSTNYIGGIGSIFLIILILLLIIYVVTMIVYLNYNENGLKCKYPWYYSIFGKNDDIVATCSKDIIQNEIAQLQKSMTKSISNLRNRENEYSTQVDNAVSSIDKSNRDFSNKVISSKGTVDATVGNAQSKIMDALSAILIQSKINKETLNAVKTMNDTSINKIVKSFNKLETSQ